MGSTVIEKILAAHCGQTPKPGDVVELGIDARLARDFGGASVVKNIEENGLSLDDPERTFFTFDCNPGGSDQRYAANQQLCRVFARRRGIRVFDIDRGIGTHLAIDLGLVGPGETLVSTDSHANIIGAVGAFGQGMGDRDIACAFARGKVWFETPRTVKVILKGRPGPEALAKDIVLAILRHLGAHGLLGCVAELSGEVVDNLSLDARITISSMATETGAIAVIIPPNRDVLDYCGKQAGRSFKTVLADPDASCERIEEIDISSLCPMISRPGHPEDVIPVADIAGRKIDSAFIGSCTNGRLEDLKAAAEILRGRKVAPGVVLKVVPSTDRIWQEALSLGLVEVFKQAGVLLGNAGCAGCAAGQIGQNGPGETTVSTGNRNFPGKQGKGDVFLASPATVAASAVAGAIVTASTIPDKPAVFTIPPAPAETPGHAEPRPGPRPTRIRGRIWVVNQDDIDTDMIFHNRHLAVTDIREMGQYAFGNLKGREEFAPQAKPGDIIVTGSNFGAGSSRQQAVDCFKALGISLIVARSFGSIYFRNAVNAGVPVMIADLVESGLNDGDEISVDLTTGEIALPGSEKKVSGRGFSPVQLAIYQRGDLLASGD